MKMKMKKIWKVLGSATEWVGRGSNRRSNTQKQSVTDCPTNGQTGAYRSLCPQQIDISTFKVRLLVFWKIYIRRFSLPSTRTWWKTELTPSKSELSMTMTKALTISRIWWDSLPVAVFKGRMLNRKIWLNWKIWLN